MAASRMVQDKTIPFVLFQSNAETPEAFAELEHGGLKRFDSVDVLFDALQADD